jgi:hypothetical protein
MSLPSADVDGRLSTARLADTPKPRRRNGAVLLHASVDGWTNAPAARRRSLMYHRCRGGLLSADRDRVMGLDPLGRRAAPAESAPGLQDAETEQVDRAADAEREAREDAARGARPEPVGPVGKVEPGQPRAASPALRRTAPTARAAAVNPGYPYYSFQARTAGKVFFTDSSDGRNYVCSGTIINSEGKNSVWTAGHCVHGGQGRNWHANWVFVPSYSYGWAPYGQWTARQLWTKNNWIGSSEWASDVGVAIMNTRNGWRIVDYLGGQGITWNQSKRIAVTSFGYPAAAPFNGQSLFTCPGTTFPEWEVLWWSAETLGLPCDMTGGSSGGAWLAFFNGTTGYLNGNNSFKYNNDPNTMYSPYYDDTASSLYGSTRFL